MQYPLFLSMEYVTQFLMGLLKGTNKWKQVSINICCIKKWLSSISFLQVILYPCWSWNYYTVNACFEESYYVPSILQTNKLPSLACVVASLCLFFFPVVLFKFSPCSALVIKSFKHKAGSMGSVYSFPKSIILHINHWSGTFGQCWICYLFFFFNPHSGCFTRESESSPVSSCTYTWWPSHLINYFCPLKKLRDGIYSPEKP